jgi:hypothetical protein
MAEEKPTALAKWAAAGQGLEKIASECIALVRADNSGRFGKAFALAQGITSLRNAITHEHMAGVMPLQGVPLGFMTDKDKENGYPENIVKDVVIEAVLNDVPLVGNCFNIIAGRFYVTKNGCFHKVLNFPGLTDLMLDFGVPEIKGDKGALVNCKARWALNGKAGELSALIPIRVNSGMGADAIVGKATRKLLARVHDRLTGTQNSLPEGEVDDLDARHVNATVLQNTNGGKMGFGGNKPIGEVLPIPGQSSETIGPGGEVIERTPETDAPTPVQHDATGAELPQDAPADDVNKLFPPGT